MHVIGFLSHWLQEHSLIAHRVRADSFLKAVAALLAGAKLSLTHIGRRRQGNASVKHQIKAVDRLLGNQKLHAERDGIYRQLAHTLLATNPRPTIIVDWADFEMRREWLMIKAAVPVRGRAITVFEQVYPFKQYNSPGAHREFLKALKKILPHNCKPIIVTDAGFRGPWFREVASHGWDWVGRIRNGIKFFNEKTGKWCLTTSLYQRATPRVQHLGQVFLARRRSYPARLYIVRAHRTRARPNRPRTPNKHQHNQRQYRRLHRDPWLLATSLPHHKHAARQIKRLYSQRMQIEETFRDMKNQRWGFGLRCARCHTEKRLQILLLIAAVATFYLWLVGLRARANAQHRHFQANTETRRPVLSILFLAQQLLIRVFDPLPPDHAKTALRDLQNLIAMAATPPGFVGIP